MCSEAKQEAAPPYVTRDEMYALWTQISDDIRLLRQEMLGMMHHLGLKPTGYPGYENRSRI